MGSGDSPGAIPGGSCRKSLAANFHVSKVAVCYVSTAPDFDAVVIELACKLAAHRTLGVFSWSSQLQR